MSSKSFPHALEGLGNLMLAGHQLVERARFRDRRDSNSW
jgi:hypothetical protein